MKLLKIFFPLFVYLLFAQGVNGQQQANAKHTLDPKQQSIVTISAFTAKGDLFALRTALNEGLDAGLTINEIKEMLVHLYAYAGFPRSLNAITTLQGVVEERQQKGLKDVEGKVSGITRSTKNKFDFGKENLTKLTGSTATGTPQRFVPVIDTFLKEHLFADIFRRNIFDYKTREIITISALAALGGAENQLRSHLNVGLHTGLTEEQLDNIVTVLRSKVGSKVGNTADSVLTTVLKRSERADTDLENTANTIFPKGVRVTNNNFTGAVWVQMLVGHDTAFNTSVGNVTFEPGSRTNWHYHPGGQLLLVTGGKGRYQEEGKPVRELHPGDVIKCEPNTKHWHGAAPDNELSHVALGTNTHKGVVVWLQAVTNEEYNR